MVKRLFAVFGVAIWLAAAFTMTPAYAAEVGATVDPVEIVDFIDSGPSVDDLNRLNGTDNLLSCIVWYDCCTFKCPPDYAPTLPEETDAPVGGKAPLGSSKPAVALS